MKELTVFTPTYNREKTLRRAYNSLASQTCKDFIWLIIDDGSTDNTKELIDVLKTEAPFPIEYHWKENGGRHTAVNYSYEFLNTKYVVTLDSDDELVPDAVEKMLRTWELITDENVWCVTGREIYAHSGELVGLPFPDNINKLGIREKRKALLKYPGEKHCCRRVDIHKQYRFPEYDDTKFITENVVWEEINRKYNQYCVNDVYGKYYVDSEDSLSTNSPHSKTKHRSAFYRDVIFINRRLDDVFLSVKNFYYLVDLPRRAFAINEKYYSVMKRLNSASKRALVSICYPAGLLFHIIRDRKGR